MQLPSPAGDADASLSAFAAADTPAAGRRDYDDPHGSADVYDPRLAATSAEPAPSTPASSTGSVHRKRDKARTPSHIAGKAAPPTSARPLGPAETGQRTTSRGSTLAARRAVPQTHACPTVGGFQLRPSCFSGLTRDALRRDPRPPPEIDERRASHDREPAFCDDRFHEKARDAYTDAAAELDKARKIDLPDPALRMRRNLAVASGILLAVKWIPLVPTKIAIFGIEVDQLERRRLLTCLALIVAYNLLVYGVRAWRTFAEAQVLFQVAVARMTHASRLAQRASAKMPPLVAPGHIKFLLISSTVELLTPIAVAVSALLSFFCL